MDGDGYHPTNSVELYLPWNNTWVSLHDLPDFPADDGAVVNMTNTLIMSVDITGAGNTLHLMGGEHTDWSTGVTRITSKVWRLRFNTDTHSYHWKDEIDSNMGKCGVWCSHVVNIFHQI